MPVRVVTDSTSDITPEAAAELGITVVPLTVFFGDEALLDGADISSGAFFERLQSSPVLPRTSQPSVAQFAEAYASAGADDVVSVHISAKLSGTMNSASLAAKDAANRVEVIDAGGASVWTAMVATAAAKAARDGKPVEEVVAAAREAAGQIDLYFLLDTLEYLQKGGRIGKAQALLGGLLSIKPVLRVHDGEVHQFEKVRTHSKALVRLRAIMRQGGPYQEIRVLHGGALDEANALASDLADLTPGTLVPIDAIGPVIGVHTGPRVVGVALRRA
jgi:DegV family protein with EDD domain